MGWLGTGRQPGSTRGVSSSRSCIGVLWPRLIFNRRYKFMCQKRWFFSPPPFFKHNAHKLPMWTCLAAIKSGREGGYDFEGKQEKPAVGQRGEKDDL